MNKKTKKIGFDILIDLIIGSVMGFGFWYLYFIELQMPLFWSLLIAMLGSQAGFILSHIHTQRRHGVIIE